MLYSSLQKHSDITIFTNKSVNCIYYKEGYVGKDKKLGPNKWCIDEPYKCPKTGILLLMLK